MLLNGLEVNTQNTLDFPLQPNTGKEVDIFNRAAVAGQLKPVGRNAKGEAAYAPAEIIAVARANNIGNWRSWASLQFSSEDRQHIASQSYWGERDFEALCFGIPPNIYCDVSVDVDEREHLRKAIHTACVNGRVHAEPTGEGNPLYGGQWRIERVSAIRWAISERFPWFPEWLASHALQEIWERQAAERDSAGRYTLRDAAEAISRFTSEDADDLVRKLVEAVAIEVLPVYMPGSNSRYRPRTVREYHDEVFWDDLNQWLDTYERRIPWRFPPPVRREDETPQQRQQRIKEYVNSNYNKGQRKTQSFRQLAALENCSVENIKRIYYKKR